VIIMKPRSYQSEAIRLIRESLRSGSKRPVLQLPTGAGKTHIASLILQMALNKGNKVLFLAPRRELIFQASKAFHKMNIWNGIIMAGVRPTNADVQVASKDTLNVRAIQNNYMDMPDADIVFIDECHLSITETYKNIISHYHDKIIIGMTATPSRGDGRGLGEIYDDLISPVTIADLTAEGYLCPVKYFAPYNPDLSGLKVQGGDYVKSELGAVMDKVELIGDIVSNWKRLAYGKKTVVFCSTMAHGRHVCDEFNANGIIAEHIDSETPKDERAAILERIESGETMVVTNVFVMSYGIDIPSLEVAVLARPTKNISLFLQTVGRVLRTHEGKDYAMVIDHSGAVAENGFVDDFIPWSLNGSDIKSEKEKSQNEKKEPKEITCSNCNTIFKAMKACPSCGYEMIRKSEPIPYYEADLQEVERPKETTAAKRNRTDSWEHKQQFIAELKLHAHNKNYKPGWIYPAYKEKYGVLPFDARLKSVPMADSLSTETQNHIKYMNIKRANR